MNDTSIVLGQELDLIQSLDARQVALLYAKMLNPDETLTALAKDMYPDLSPSYRAKIVGDGKLSRVLKLAKSSPNLAAWLMSIKLMPLSILTLHHILTQGVKDNVKVTASKELNRVAEAAVKSMSSQVKVNPSSNIDKLLTANDKSSEPIDNDADSA